ncbi:hypothetical protein SNE40_003313 [Patella caerulea]
MGDGEPHKPESKIKQFSLRYMQHPPRIVPNYGKKKVQLLPKTNVSRVLLYDNVTQQQMLYMKLKNIRIEKNRSGRLLDMHRKSFIYRRLKKQRNMLESSSRGIHKDVALPPLVNGTETNIQHIRKHQIDDDVQLPQLSRNRKVGFSQIVNGITHMFNTFQIEEEGTALHEKSVRDPRFKSLEKGLVHLDKPGDGYLELSPSFVKDYSAIPKNIKRIGLVPLLKTDGPPDE